MAAPLSNSPLPDIATARLGPRHWWILFVASLGQIIGTGTATLVGVAIPMIQLVSHPELPGWLQGVLAAMDLVGIAVGSYFIGRWSDRLGYLAFFRAGPLLILLAALAALVWPSVGMLLVCLFVIGFGIGGEYSLDSDYVSELMPRRWRFLMVGVCKATCAFGNIGFAAGCLWIVSATDAASAWPRLLWLIAAFAALMIVCRLRFAQSPRWLLEHGHPGQAQQATRRLLGPGIATGPCECTPAQKAQAGRAPLGWRRVIVSGIPWACEGLGVYGIGVFIPVLVMALGLEAHAGPADTVGHVAASVRVTLWISLLIVPGFAIGLWRIVKGAGLAELQTRGFAMCALSLVLLWLAWHFGWAKGWALGAFMAFELFLNIGPHLVTYIMPSRIYPVVVRGRGSGLAASMGKVGAVAGVFFVPVLLQAGGPGLVLWVSVAVMAIGAIVTWLLRDAVKAPEPTDAPQR